MNPPDKLFVPGMWSKDTHKMLTQQTQIQRMLADNLMPQKKVWEVWFAWFPVKVAFVTRYEEVHDEVIMEGYTRWRWRWLVHVTRRPNRHRWYPPFQPYEYGPATNALTQPDRPNFRG